jgi:hypothetical protein
MSSLAAVAERIAQPQGASSKTEYDHGSLLIRRNTLVIGNAIYPVENISTITFSDLRNPVPTIVWVMLGGGLVCLLTVVLAPLGIILLGLGAYLLYLNYKEKSAADYALTVQMNSGGRALVMSNDGDFLKAIAVELYQVIELERAANTIFNIDQRTRIDRVGDGSRISVTGIHGDILSNVERL